MKRLLAALVLSTIIVVWPLYLMNITITQNDAALNNLQSQVEDSLDRIIYHVNGVEGELKDYFEVLREDVFADLNLSVLDSCGIITNGMSHGSCVAIRPNLMLTAGHCIGIDGAWIEVDGQQYRILKQWKSEQYDVGLVEIEGELPFVELAERNPGLLNEVFLVGSPYSTVLERTITRGIISHLERNIYDHIGLIQTDAEAAPGSSGCPLFDINEKVIGICIAGPNPGGGVTLCEPVEHIRQALKEYDRSCE